MVFAARISQHVGLNHSHNNSCLRVAGPALAQADGLGLANRVWSQHGAGH